MELPNSMFFVLLAATFASCSVLYAVPAWTQSAQSFSNLYEPSGAASLSDGMVIVVEDEGDHPIRILSINFEKGELTLSSETLKGELAEVDDIEGVAVGKNDDIFLITSHSVTKKGTRSKTREQLIKLTIKGDQISTYQSFGNLLPFIQSNLNDSLNMKKKDLENINIEGLTFNATKEILLIGMRSPLHNHKALILSLVNPYDLFSKKHDPIFDDEILSLDLEGAGIRAITYDKKNNRYLIAGEAENKKNKLRSRIWAWDGLSKTRPGRLDIPKVKKMKNIEGVTIVHHESLSYLLFVCDTGKKKTNKGGRYGFIDIEKL